MKDTVTESEEVLAVISSADSVSSKDVDSAGDRTALLVQASVMEAPTGSLDIVPEACTVPFKDDDRR